MKRLFCILFLLITSQIFAQFGQSLFSKDPIINLENFDRQRVHWGYFLGFSSFDFKTDYKVPGNDLDVKGQTGFNVGLVGNLRLHEYIDLRFEPGLYYASRTLTYSGFISDIDAIREVKATYINFPLLFKFSCVIIFPLFLL